MLLDWLKKNPQLAEQNQELILTVVKHVSKLWKESNLRITKTLFSILEVFCKNEEITLRRGAYNIFHPFLNMKILKFYDKTKQLLIASCDSIKPKYVFTRFINWFISQKKLSPAIYAKSCSLLIKCLEQLTLKYLPTAELIKASSFFLDQTNNTIRKEGVRLAKNLYILIGDKYLGMLTNIK